MLLDLTKTKFDIIIAAGQSNCEGWGVGDVVEPYSPNDRIWSMEQDFSICTAHEKTDGKYTVGSFPLIFASEYFNKYLESDRHLLLINTAIGGTGFVPNAEKITWRKGELLSTRMLEMVKAALELHEENRVVAFLWHQGEQEVLCNTPPNQHFNNMTELFDDVQKNFGTNVPFILGDFVEEWKLEQGKKAIDIANTNRQIAEKYNGFFVNTEGLTSNRKEVKDFTAADGIIHFSRKALYELGKRYFQKYSIIPKNH